MKSTSPQRGCLSLDTIVKNAQSNSFESQEYAEQVYQARHQIGKQLGRLVPQISLNLGAQTSAQDLWQVVPSLVGFIYPSNWYNWNEAKQLYEAQRYSYMTLIANHTNIAISLYINIHAQQHALRIASHYDKEISKSIAFVEGQIEDVGRFIDPEMMGILKSIQSRIQYSMEVTKNSISEMLPQLANATNHHSDWLEFCIQPLELPLPEKVSLQGQEAHERSAISIDGAC